MATFNLRKCERTQIKITQINNTSDNEVLYEYDVYNGNEVCGHGKVLFLNTPNGQKAHDKFYKRYVK